ncbi:hypothetical protein [Jiella sonneratiae]|uniref:Uncharacterized protein n=1 Tax=Jiella sonneratiae TaxID=2816856 RepID=A0ABS3JA28_9HYPH|nr:hypothetical protein [Jiella sonneratiae]MBO0906528.1 hypothetical protein [Jiella sonneratiae]
MSAGDRHDRACARGERIDVRWFARHPGRVLRVRQSLPFEGSEFGPEGHRRSPYALVFLDGAVVRRRFFYAHRMPDLDTATLAALWDFIAASVPERPGGDMVPVNPVQCLQIEANAAACRMQIDRMMRGAA